MKNAIIFCFLLFLIDNVFGQNGRITVSKDGTGNFKTIQDALNSISSSNNKRVIIFIKPGVYKEVVTIDATKNFITLEGTDENNTIISFNNHSGIHLANGDTINTWTSPSAFVYGNDFQAHHISFENNAGFNAGQAVALRVEGTRGVFKNCRMIGFQDVLFLSGSGAKLYFKDCYIEGTTDFIFGASTAVFKNCLIM